MVRSCFFNCRVGAQSGWKESERSNFDTQFNISLRTKNSCYCACLFAPDVVQMTSELRLLGSATCIPHPEKVETGGEDAHFVSAAGKHSRHGWRKSERPS